MLPVFQIIHAGFNITARKQLVNDHIIATDRDALVQVVKIVVVIGKTYREPADDKRRKIFAVTSPLLLGVALYQLLVNIGSHQADGLLLQVSRLTSHCLLLLLNDRLCLCRSADAPHLAEGIHIKRHIVHLALVIGYRAVGVAVELSQIIYIIPHLTVAGMEDVCSVTMHMNPLHILAIHISADMIAFFHNQTGFSTFLCLVRPDSCIKSASNQYIIIFLHNSCPPCLSSSLTGFRFCRTNLRFLQNRLFSLISTIL